MAKQKYEGNLVQQKNDFRIRGIITGKDTPSKFNGFKEGKTKGETPKSFKSIRFLLKSAEDNIVPVELFAMPQDFAYAYNKTKKETLKINWKERNNKLPEDYNLITPDYDLVDIINKDYKDGDSVVIVGEIQFSEYVNEGKVQLQKKYIIKRIMPSTEPVDFSDENFIEENDFKQNLTIKEVVEDKTANRLFVYANIIGYAGKFAPAELEINTETADKQFVKNFKGLKFGDTLTVEGIIQNRAIGSIVKEDDGWGKHKATTSYWKALEIVGAIGDSLEVKKYKETDFVTEAKDAKSAKDVLAQIENAQEDDGEPPFELD